MWLLQVLLLLPKVLLCHLLRTLPALTGCSDHGMGPGDPKGHGCWSGHPGKLPWHLAELAAGTGWTLTLLFTRELCSQMCW